MIVSNYGSVPHPLKICVIWFLNMRKTNGKAMLSKQYIFIQGKDIYIGNMALSQTGHDSYYVNIMLFSQPKNVFFARIYISDQSFKYFRFSLNHWRSGWVG